MSLVTLAILSMFGAFVGGGIAGVLIGRFTRFEIGLGAGLLVPGVVCLWFAALCLSDYRAFTHAGANAGWGEVISIVDLPVNSAGNVSQPVPVVRFTAHDKSVHTVHGPASGGYKVGDALSVIYNPVEPERSRFGNRAELRGGAIAMMLFGTFPFSLGLWFLYTYLFRREGVQAPSDRHRHIGTARSPVPMIHKALPAPLNITMFCGILWIGTGTGELERRFVEGFGVVAVALLCYALWGAVWQRANASWCLGVATLGINFGVWAFALHLLV